jgi:hypothetical protein
MGCAEWWLEDRTEGAVLHCISPFLTFTSEVKITSWKTPESFTK